ncbi:hypothetical protein HPB47_001847 [Ixodes persulcatus]|uniref:Uncharacterized protein n=1 Tax=Ixodes persulcatus TaxID=34615 RepID=A0AC60PMZ4_IXOPE|nr:hypothetical protein HPB47_001847 [Ixodes persulcatus]
MDVKPEECAGWLHVKIGKKKNEASEVKPNTRAVRRTMAATTRAARMPEILPEEENKIIVRPRGGLNLARTSVITIMAAIRSAANLTQAETMFDTQCPNVQQNIMVISTPDDLRARRYPGVKEIKIGDRTYEVSAYAAAPNGAVKGVVRGIPIEDSAATITENILTVRNPKARAAQRIGTSTTIIVVFEGPRVPNYVYYGGGMLRCTLYRKYFEVCRGCGKVGHRADVCPTPEAKVCIGCGEETDQAHQCTPKCKLCGGPHITGDRECKNKFKTPYIARRWQWERKELSPVEGAKQEKAGKGIPPKNTAEHFPLLRAPRSRTPTRVASRSRSRSAGGKATWAQVAEPANKEMKTLREANRQQAKKIAEQEETIRRMAADMAAMKEMLQKMVNKNQTAEDEEPAENAEEPPAKRRSPEAGRIRRSEERQDKSEMVIWERMDRLEEGCRSMEGQFNAMGLKNKRATLQQHIRNQKRKPDVIMIQETTSQDPKLSGYRTHAKSLEQNQRGICTFVRRGVNSLEHDSKGDPKLEKQAVEIIVGKESIFLTKVYSNPKQSRQRFKNLFHENLRRAGDSTLVVAGDFNAPHTSLGHQTISYKGRNLIQDATEADLQLITDPRQATLTGRKSTDRDTTPDLVFTNEEETSWANTKEDLGSDHCIVEINVPLKGKTRDLLRATTSASREIETTEETDGKMDSRLAHLIEAKQSICNRWKKQRLNRKLRKKIAELNGAIHEHCTKLSAQQRKLNSMIRKAYKNSLGLFANTSTERMESLGVHNRLEEFKAARQTAQVARLEKTRTGRETLRRLDIEAQASPEDKTVQSGEMKKLDIRPIPRHMHPLHDAGRRQARAQALTKEHADSKGTVHVEAARHGDHFVAAVVRACDCELVTAASVKTQEVRVAEEVAISLAASLPTVSVVFSDSMKAIRNFMAGRVSPEAERTLRRGTKERVVIKWFPAHEAGNAVANAMARALVNRANRPPPYYEPREYGEMLRIYRLDRQELPPPHPNLTRKEARRKEASQEADLPPELKEGIEEEDYEHQLQAVQQITALLERQKPPRALAKT